MQGKLIAFEGIDGTGKSTQIRMLADYLSGLGCDVVLTREPTDGPYGQKIRQLYHNRSEAGLERELELFILDRKEHVDRVIRPALARGAVVLTDRYYFSTAAYQGAAGADVEAVFAANRFAPVPDLVVLLLLDPEKSVERISQGRGERPNDFEQVDQLRRVADLFTSFPHPCIRAIDADRDPELIQQEIRRLVQPLVTDCHGGRT